MKLQTARAIYKDGTLVFADPALAPKGMKEVVVTYLDESPAEVIGGVDPIQLLRGRGKGERLVEKLLRARREDREHDERSHRSLRT